MATKTIQVTSKTSCTFTYTATTNPTNVVVKVTKVAWKNTRSGGLTEKISWQFGMICSDGEWHYISGTAAKGATSWSKTFTLTDSSERFPHDTTLTVYTSANFDTSSDYYYKHLSFDVAVPALQSWPVGYSGNGATGGSTASQTKYYGEALTLRQNGYTRTGYAFHRWNTEADASGTWYSAGASYTGNAALDLYAIWTPVIYFDANGGELGSVPASATKAYGSPYVIPTATPTRADHEFLGWATSATAAQKDDRYDPGDSYSGEDTLTLHAVWKRLYAPPALSIAAMYRSDAQGNADDEGRFVALDATYTLFDTAAAGGSANAPSWLLSCNGQSTATPASGGTGLSGSVLLVLDAGLSTELPYTAEVTLSDIGGASRAVTVSYRLGTAYYPIDVLGDGKLYQPTADTAVDLSKTYYTRTGSGSQADPYVYTAVEYPVTTELPTYFEASGPRPGRGVAIGGAATHEGLDVMMPAYSYGRQDYPLFVYATAPDEADLPVTPCFVLATSDYGLWYYDGQ